MAVYLISLGQRKIIHSKYLLLTSGIVKKMVSECSKEKTCIDLNQSRNCLALWKCEEIPRTMFPFQNQRDLEVPGTVAITLIIKSKQTN